MNRFRRLVLPLFLLLSVSPACLEGQEFLAVKRVIDGDTFELAGGERVRLIGVDTPESVKPGEPVERFGPEASSFTEKMIEGKEVRLVFDVQTHDRYRRLLAYVYLKDGTFLNAELVRRGFATVMTVPPNVRHAEMFLNLQQEARAEKRGLWGSE